jgi:hypothetical protein
VGPSTREQCQFTSEISKRSGRVAAQAGVQQGRVTYRQLRLLGFGEATVGEWVRAGRLLARQPGVYAVGHTARTVDSDQWEAILYAGPGAMLSHLSAAWRRGLIDYPPRAIHVSSPRRRRDLPGIVVHGRRALERCDHDGLPITSVPRTLLDLAATDERRLLRKALARLDFNHTLDAAAIEAICRRGRAGSAALRRALIEYDPRFGRTLSALEDDFLLVCEAHDIPKPDEVNVRIQGILCDLVYREPKLIVELDGAGNHHSPAQISRDRANDLTLRAHGWLVLRYGWRQVHDDPEGIREEILRELAARRAV